METIGPGFGYYPNATKTKLLVKTEHVEYARTVFRETSIEITTEGVRLLGSVIGGEMFTNHYLTEKMKEWASEIKNLAEIPKTEPQATFACLTHGLLSIYTFLMRTTPGLTEHFSVLRSIILEEFLPSLFGKSLSDELLRICALPVQEGGLGIPDFLSCYSVYTNSINLCRQMEGEYHQHELTANLGLGRDLVT